MTIHHDLGSLHIQWAGESLWLNAIEHTIHRSNEVRKVLRDAIDTDLDSVESSDANHIESSEEVLNQLGIILIDTRIADATPFAILTIENDLHISIHSEEVTNFLLLWRFSDCMREQHSSFMFKDFPHFGGAIFSLDFHQTNCITSKMTFAILHSMGRLVHRNILAGRAEIALSEAIHSNS